jgi:hypothetical protein
MAPNFRTFTDKILLLELIEYYSGYRDLLNITQGTEI